MLIFLSIAGFPLVGVAGFEPTAFRSQSGRATKLRHTPLLNCLRANRRRSINISLIFQKIPIVLYYVRHISTL